MSSWNLQTNDKNMKNGWIGVDLDGCLAKYEGWVNAGHIGEPVPAMLDRVKCWLAEGIDVRIFTARVGPQKDVNETIRAREAIERWCMEHLSAVLPITATKDFACTQIWDDRAMQVIPNTGVSYQALAAQACRLVEQMRDPEADPEEIELLAVRLNSFLA